MRYTIAENSHEQQVMFGVILYDVWCNNYELTCSVAARSTREYRSAGTPRGLEYQETVLSLHSLQPAVTRVMHKHALKYTISRRKI